MSLATTPVLSRNTVVQVGGTAIGFLTDFTMNIKAEMVKEYVCQPTPTAAFVASGNQSNIFKASALFVPSTYATLLSDVLNGTLVHYLGTTRHHRWKPEGYADQCCPDSLQCKERAKRHNCKRHKRRSTNRGFRHILST